MTGTFFAVVGPSGAGKDTLIARAREVLEPSGRYHFPARYITRPADAGGEDHVAVSRVKFAAILASRGFCLTWRAHGLSYGIPADVDGVLAVGRNVVANLSREAIGPARRRFLSLRVIVVTAPVEVIALRLAARGREDAGAIARRLRRADRASPVGSDVDVIDNGGAIDDASRAFIALLERHACREESA